MLGLKARRPFRPHRLMIHQGDYLVTDDERAKELARRNPRLWELVDPETAEEPKAKKRGPGRPRGGDRMARVDEAS